METFGAGFQQAMSHRTPFSSWVKYPHSDFLLNPIFLHGFSASLHTLLLIAMFLSWVCKKFRLQSTSRYSKEARFLYHRLVLSCSLVLSLYNLVFCCLDYFYYWHGVGLSDQQIVTLLDLLIRSLSWLGVFVYLYTQFPNLGDSKFPSWLRVWWCCYLALSINYLVIDVVQRGEDESSHVQYLVSDIVYVVSGLVLFYAGLFGKALRVDTPLEEPLLNGNGNANLEDKTLVEGSGAVTPYSHAGILSKLTFTWMGTLIATGYKKILDLEDVPLLPLSDSIKGSFPAFRGFLDSARSSGGRGGRSKVTKLHLVKALILTTWKDIVFTGFLALLNSLASYVGPALIDTFVQYLNGKRYNNEGYALVSAFFVAKLVECFAQRHWFFRLQCAGIKGKSVLVAMIYNKGLTLSCQSKQGQSSGEIINILSVDADRIGTFAWYMHEPWMVLLQIALAMVILYKNLGLAAISAFVMSVVVMLANFPISSLLDKYQDKFMESKDKRMKSTSEILKNMRILKLQGWEMKFLSKIVELRKGEIGWLKKYLYTWSISSFLFWASPIFVAVVTFVSCMLLGVPLESGKILSALATFRILQETITNLPDTVSMIIQTKVSLDRVASFLSLDDLQPDAIERLPRASSEVAVEIVGGDFTWDQSLDDPTLKNINLRVLHGMRVAICGAVGTGKSSLLSCILGEIPKVSGALRVSGSKAYVAQSAWIQSGKVVDNILFGKEMDPERYERVLEACSLNKDLEILAFGDQTVIGERGINLSGGQKQRIQIARALYQDADIYLFDDPFSAVDAHTGSHLFKECLLGFLKSKTVIYVTHQVEFLPAADLILVMKNGRISQVGKYNDILSAGTDFMNLVGAHEKALSTLDSFEGSSGSKLSNVDGSCSDVNAVEDKENNDDQSSKIDATAVPKGQLVQDEEREKGGVGFSVYWKYLTTAYGGALVPLILLAQILYQVLQIASNYWMAWATPISADAKPVVSGRTLIVVYVALALASAFCTLSRATLLVTAAYKTATLLFTKMHLCIFRAPMSFFDSTPSGRILNRASTDQSAVDIDIPFQVGGFGFAIIQLLGIIAVMSQVAWQVFVVFIPVIAISFWYQHYYIPSARELSRLVGVCKAPIIQHFSETISGAATIRSFDHQLRFQQTNEKLIDNYARPNFHIAAAMEWLCFRLDMLSSITFIFSLIFLVSVPVGLIDPGIAGLAVTYGLNLNMLQAWVIWNLCMMENKIISVERMLQYCSIPSEPPLVIEENRPDHSWPSHGEVNIHDLQVRYAPHMPLVLQGITCTFHGGKKTGIVGRTGSGKSTLIQTLFRIVEPEAGSIVIDGINILSIGLHDLRSRLSIIPQDPTMFEGTVRSNLDPLEEYTDEQIWEALDKCQLGDEVRKKEGKLDSSVTENGENWSMGQRQLVCLGRVLLKKSKVLVLDEATASVDTASDNLIQQTIRQHFAGSTVIVIAHRITSVIDSDMVLLLSNGQVDEFDTPMRLLENKSSSFAKLVAEYSSRSKSSHI
ncbi:Canalicular multispecific organic anion transporter 2 [Dionaea muscipula]